MPKSQTVFIEPSINVYLSIITQRWNLLTYWDLLKNGLLMKKVFILI